MPSVSPSTRRLSRFLGKVVLIYAVWYGIYDLWLLPSGHLDQWVSLSVVEAGHHLLSGVGFDVEADGRTLVIPGTPGIQIVDGCNGLSTIGLFVGFVLAFPGKARRRAVFLPLGIAVIYASNVTRIVTLLLFQRYWNSGFDFVHSLGAPAFFYLIVFGLWMLWANYGGQSPRPSPSDVKQTRPATP